MKTMTEEDYALTALAAEANRRGFTYGELVAKTSREERDEIIRKYIKRKRAGRERS